MGKRSREKHRSQDSAMSAGSGEVGPRAPCPCGSGRRYKACHGDPAGTAATFVARPFAGLNGECDLVAMREFVPAASAPLKVLGHEDRDVLLCSLLPGAAPALVRESGAVWLGLQVQHGFGDPSRDLAAALLSALDAAPGSQIEVTDDPGPGPRLQDVLVDAPLEVRVHDGFDYWLADVEDPDSTVAAALDSANGAISPTTRLASVPAAYWADVTSKEHLRWAMPHQEDRLLDALARLHVSGADQLVVDSRLVGMFRAHGLLAPVWDLAPGTGAEALEEPSARFAELLESALVDSSALSSQERSARAGLANRQLTLR